MFFVTLDSLFSEWKEHHTFHTFIKDGIVDPAHYESPHILFILRDMNCQEDFDLRWHLREYGSGWKTWNNIGRWTKALLDHDAEYPADMSQPARIKEVRRIAAMNFKKEGGSSRAVGSELLEAVCTQKDYILKEIELCDPQIIIACGLSSSSMMGNASLIHQFIYDGKPQWETLKSPYWEKEWYYFKASVNGRTVPVVSFCHPQVTTMAGLRGHQLFELLYKDMQHIRKVFLDGNNDGI